MFEPLDNIGLDNDLWEFDTLNIMWNITETNYVTQQGFRPN